MPQSLRSGMEGDMKCKSPDLSGLNWELGNVLLSHGIPHTIIGDDPFHCPVRDGKEWDQVSIVTKQFFCLTAILVILLTIRIVRY